METLKTDLKSEMLNYLEKVNRENFLNSYDGLISIIIKYKDLGLSKNDVVGVIDEITNTDLNDYQDEVIMEVSNCLHGFAPPDRRIDW